MAGPTLDLGACQVNWGAADLGSTNEGVVLRFSEDYRDVMADQKGTNPTERIGVGGTIEVDVPLTQGTTATLSSLIASASGSGTSGEIMVIKARTGYSYLDRAQQLILKPMANGIPTAATAKWVYVYLASPAPDIEISFDNENQRVYKVTFFGFPDVSGSPPNRLWGIGG